MGRRGSLGLEDNPNGLVLRALGLWLDPIQPTPMSFVSHLHAARSTQGRALASPETLALARALTPEPTPWGERLDWDGSIDLPIDPAFGAGTARLTIARAGHVLGAAQLVVDHPRGRLVYTGDWSGERDGTHEAGDVVRCDELVVTSTFALPIFRFEPVARVLSTLGDWCAARLAEGARPIVLAQNPGPAQAIARALVGRGLPVVADETVFRACAAYGSLGAPLGTASEREDGARDAVLIVPANSRAADLRGRDRAVIAYASGWALLDSAVEQKRADAAFAIAGHADCDALTALVEATGARHVVVSRGDARAFAHVLRGRGIKADAIEHPAIDERGHS
jgi:Cft2 family RNA processing exonuclease